VQSSHEDYEANFRLVGEAIDGATAFPLMAAAEGCPATPGLQPWEPLRPAPR